MDCFRRYNLLENIFPTDIALLMNEYLIPDFPLDEIDHQLYLASIKSCLLNKKPINLYDKSSDYFCRRYNL